MRLPWANKKGAPWRALFETRSDRGFTPPAHPPGPSLALC
jgi:hypothetical protein